MDEPNVRLPALIGQGSANLLSGNAYQDSQLLTQAADEAVRNKEHGLARVAMVWLSRTLLVQGHIKEAFNVADRAVAESQAQFGPQVRSFATLASARVMIAQGKIVPAQKQIGAALSIAKRYGYKPLEIEPRILLAGTISNPGERRSQLGELAKTADARGWSGLHPMHIRRSQDDQIDNLKELWCKARKKSAVAITGGLLFLRGQNIIPNCRYKS